MNTQLSADTLKGFEHTAILAHHFGNGYNKKLVLVTFYNENTREIQSGLKILNNNAFVTSTVDLRQAIEIYNSL